MCDLSQYSPFPQLLKTIILFIAVWLYLVSVHQVEKCNFFEKKINENMLSIFKIT